MVRGGGGSRRPSSDSCLIALICAFTGSLKSERSRQLPRRRSEPQARGGGFAAQHPLYEAPGMGAAEATEMWQGVLVPGFSQAPGQGEGFVEDVWGSEEIPGRV